MKKRGVKLKMALRRTAAAGLAGCVLLCGGIQANAATLKDVFDEHYYADTYPDLKEAFGYDREALWNHFLRYGLSENRTMNGLIDVTAYRNQYADLNTAFGDDWNAYLNHYLIYGAKEGRDPGTEFDALDYAARYEDLQAAYGSNVLELWKHYKEIGVKENRDGRNQALIDAEQEAAAEEEASQENETAQPDDSQGSGTHIPTSDEVMGITRNEAGLMIRREFSEGKYATFDYNDDEWLIKLVYYMSDEAVVELDWDDEGRITNCTMNVEKEQLGKFGFMIGGGNWSIIFSTYPSGVASIYERRYDDNKQVIMQNQGGGSPEEFSDPERVRHTVYEH